jgi:hypothetical protein
MSIEVTREREVVRDISGDDRAQAHVRREENA